MDTRIRNQLIDFKRSLGFKYFTEEIIYSIFDRFTIELGETKVGISKELSDKWCERKNNESESYWIHRSACLARLSSYLCKIGIRSYIPQLPKHRSTFVPFVFSKNEMGSVFAAADALRAQRKMMNSIIFVMLHLLDSDLQDYRKIESYHFLNCGIVCDTLRLIINVLQYAILHRNIASYSKYCSIILREV